MRKIALLALLLPLSAFPSWAWHDSAAARKALTALFHNLEAVQSQFSALGAQQPLHPDLYMPIDLDNDGVWEIWVRSHDGKAGILYGQAPDGTLRIIASDTESEEMAISGNLISIAAGKYAGVSEAGVPVYTLAAMVCFAEGELVSAFDFWGCGDQSAPHSTALINDSSLFLWPEFMVMAGTDAGLELYLRHTDSEKSAYCAIREVGNQWVEVLRTTMWNEAY